MHLYFANWLNIFNVYLRIPTLVSLETLVLLWTIDAREELDMREEVTVSVEVLVLLWTINVSEKRDIPGAFKQADMGTKRCKLIGTKDSG